MPLLPMIGLLFFRLIAGGQVQEHPFAQYVRILGKGKKGSRSLTLAQAQDAMAMILDEQVHPEQLGAFLMLLRVKEESAEELAGFIRAVRTKYKAPDHVKIDLDWSTYAGKKRQLPWFLLSALVLAENGYKVFMHGAKGHTAGRIYTEQMLASFNLPSCQNWGEVAQQLDEQNFAFMGIDKLAPKLSKIIELRHIFGLRSPVHTLCRMLNPLLSKACIDGVFHPAYAPMHQHTSALLGVENSLTIRGDGGEAEIRPDADCETRWIKKGHLSDELWPRIYPKREVKEAQLDTHDLLSTWRGERAHHYGEGAVISTLAATLIVLGGADGVSVAQQRAQAMWQSRDKKRF